MSKLALALDALTVETFAPLAPLGPVHAYDSSVPATACEPTCSTCPNGTQGPGDTIAAN